MDSLKELDSRAISALKTLKFNEFDNFLMDTKASVPDQQVYGIFLWLIEQYLLEDAYEFKKLSEAEESKAFQSTANFRVVGQTWSYPSFLKSESCISFLAAVVNFEEVKHIPDQPIIYDNSTNKCV
ncbi:unnamed protein product [Protopolystoma xenopodis]|uniref:Uncharacterized protein n=1 Tax=Protopolystoma xenopodis TaxID=117903 RepID=A0A3S4ZU27_9PLAT|nr:unnamed protein product [Protopolystoma xenopodis]